MFKKFSGGFTLVLVMLLVTSIFSVNVQASYSQGKLDGAERAKNAHNGAGYFWAGLTLTTFFTPILGGISTLGAAYSSNPNPNTAHLRDNKYSTEYICSYIDEYTKVARNNNIKNAWSGVGTGCLVSILFLVYSDLGVEQNCHPKTMPVLRLSF